MRMPSFGSNAQVEFEIAAPPRLPRNRPRALTYPLPVEPDNPQQTCDQSKSALVSLPFEIRRQIWIEILSGHLLHITRDAKRLVAIDCTVNIDETKAEFETHRHGCWGVTDCRPWMNSWRMPGCYQRPRDGHPARPANLLPLLQTCRLIYTETVSMLYEDNIFDINHINMLIYLERCVLPKRLNQIRVLNLTWGFTYPPVPFEFHTWLATCEVLARFFTGLQELTLYLTRRYDSMPGPRWQNGWELFFEPLMQIKAAKKFDVFVPWNDSQRAEVAHLRVYPFRLLRESNARTTHNRIHEYL